VRSLYRVPHSAFSSCVCSRPWVQVSWAKGFEQRNEPTTAIGQEKRSANRENVVFLTTGGPYGTAFKPRDRLRSSL
jgi:hypothetical protein